MRRLLAESLYVMTVHGQEEMEADGLTLEDVERTILNGEIIQRQSDQLSGEAKYVIEGRSPTKEPVRVVAKLGPTGRLVIITVYRVTNEGDS